jgi:D-glycero-alpha-D-manno-heptose-7-phosphate kinase
MILTRTPLRISLGGGGTDLPSFYRHHGGGFLIAAAISKYIYIAVHRNFDDDLIIKYSQIERVSDVATIQHPILREALELMEVGGGVEVTSMADIPAGTGLGSSGAFTVGLLRALHSHLRQPVTNGRLAEMACHIEIDRLNEPVGKQDQYASAVGGLTAFEFREDDTVGYRAVEMPSDAKLALEEDLLLFYTGVRRSASEEISAQVDGGGGRVEDNLKAVREIGHESLETLQAGDLDGFARLLTKQWELKLERSPSPLHHQIDDMIRAGIDAGAGGGKLIGAGGGGFLLFHADAKAPLRAEMHRLGLEEVRFSFDHEGSMNLVV